MTTPKITITDGTRPLAVFVRTELAPEQDPDEYDAHAYPNHLPRWGIKDQRHRAVRAHERSGGILPRSNNLAMAMNKRGPIHAVWLDREGKTLAFDETDNYEDVDRITYQFPGFALRGDKLDGILDKLVGAGMSSVPLSHLQRAAHLTS